MRRSGSRRCWPVRCPPHDDAAGRRRSRRAPDRSGGRARGTSRSSEPATSGIPLAQVFCDAGRSVVLLDVDTARVAALNRGESPVEDVPERAASPPRRRRARRNDRLRRPARGRRDPDRAADAALETARARPVDLARRGARDLDAPARRPSRRARVDDVPGNDDGGAEADPRSGERPRRRAPTSTWRSRRSGSTPAEPTGRPATCRRSWAASPRRAPPPRPRSTALPSTPSIASRRRRRRR